jgi:prophage antirepressor-like protein
MANSLNTFNFEGTSPLRSVIQDEQPWFVAKDVCAVLAIANHLDATSRLDEDERGESVIPTPFGDHTFTVISESGLYALIFKSRKPEAKRFRKWVTSEVLPALRTQGTYSVPSPEQ